MSTAVPLVSDFAWELDFPMSPDSLINLLSFELRPYGTSVRPSTLGKGGLRIRLLLVQGAVPIEKD